MKKLIYISILLLLTSCPEKKKAILEEESIVVKGHQKIESGYLDFKKTTLKKWEKQNIIIKDYDSLGLQFHTSDLLINLGKVTVEQNENVTKYDGSKAFSIATDIRQLEHGNTLLLDTLIALKPKGNFMFLQNLKKARVGYVFSDGAGYKEKPYSNAVTFLKIDNAITNKGDRRNVNYKKIEFKNSHYKNFKNFVASCFIDEGTRNVTIDSLLIDLPFKSTKKKGSGGHGLKYGHLKNKLSKRASTFYDFDIGTIYLDSTKVIFENCRIDTLISKGSIYTLINTKPKHIIDLKNKLE